MICGITVTALTKLNNIEINTRFEVSYKQGCLNLVSV